MASPLAVISGGSRGLGFQTACALGLMGYDLVLIAKRAEGLAAAKEKLLQDQRAAGRGGQQVSVFECDLENPELTGDLVAQVKAQFPAPQALVLAHGVMSAKMSKTLKTDAAEWRRVLSINLDSVFQLINAIAPAMVESRDGRVVVFSACLGRMSGPGNAGGLAPYRISKAGVNALVRNLAHETGLGSRGFLVDAVCPGHSRTDMGGPDAPRSPEEGAATAIWLATRPFDPTSADPKAAVTGVLWEDMSVVPW